VFGVLLLSAPSLLSVSGAAAPPPASSAMAAMTMSAQAPQRSARACAPSVCPIPRPGAKQLAVAGELGPALAALWSRRDEVARTRDSSC
jgi:hypothetical protein